MITERGKIAQQSNVVQFSGTIGLRLLDEIAGRGWPEVLPAIVQFRDPLYPFIEDTLYQEIKSITVDNLSAAQSVSAPTLDKALENSDVDKGSLESFLKKWLPKWLLNALELLNEIIKILKGAA